MAQDFALICLLRNSPQIMLKRSTAAATASWSILATACACSSCGVRLHFAVATTVLHETQCITDGQGNYNGCVLTSFKPPSSYRYIFHKESTT